MQYSALGKLVQKLWSDEHGNQHFYKSSAFVFLVSWVYYRCCEGDKSLYV